MRHQPLKSLMMSYKNTRVRAPNTNLYIGGDRIDDSVTLKLPRRGVTDDMPVPSPDTNYYRKHLKKKDGDALVSCS